MNCSDENMLPNFENNESVYKFTLVSSYSKNSSVVQSISKDARRSAAVTLLLVSIESSVDIVETSLFIVEAAIAGNIDVALLRNDDTDGDQCERNERQRKHRHNERVHRHARVADER